jgi:NAD-dependent dihydropyrimidine dehydrogenase PreA subunit
MKTDIITIDENKCNGCGLCITNCPEGALQIVDGKAILVNEIYCDGLGACIGHCPEGAITIETREREAYDELKVMENIVKKGPETIKEHLQHLYSHNETVYLDQAINFLNTKQITIPDYKDEQECGCNTMACPGSKVIDRTKDNNFKIQEFVDEKISKKSELRQWPVQLALLNPSASYLQNADLVISADCVPFAFSNFHQKFLKDKVLIIFCPKLDDTLDSYLAKLTTIFKENNIQSITIVRMEVPCCGGVTKLVGSALLESGKNIFVKEYTISVDGEIV